MAAAVTDRVQKHRAALRAAGLRPIQLWVPDTRAKGFAEECRRQSMLCAASDRQDQELMTFLDEFLDDAAGWE